MRIGLWRKLSAEELMLLNVVLENSWESLGLQGDPTSPSQRRSVLGVHWKDWCWSWNFSTLATSWEELTHWKRPWWWEGLGAGGGGNNRGWDGWIASPTRWTWVWVNPGNWWWTGRLGVLQFMGSQRVGHDWATELNWLKQQRIYFRKIKVQKRRNVLPSGDCWAANNHKDTSLKLYEFSPPVPQFCSHESHYWFELSRKRHV